MILAPGFPVAASSFATATVDTNLVEYLYNSGAGDEAGDTGFDVWLFAYRASPDSDNVITDYTIDDIVDYDWPAAVKYVLAASGQPSVDAIAHCVGSMSLLMTLLNGLEGIHSIINSHLTLHPVTNCLNFCQSDVNLVKILELG